MDILKLLTETEDILIRNNAIVLKYLNKVISFEYSKINLGVIKICKMASRFSKMMIGVQNIFYR